MADQRPIYVYDVPSEILNSIALKTDTTATEPPDAARAKPSQDQTAPSDASLGAQSCSLCSLSFSSLQEQRSHLKSDLHQYNLKQKLRGARPVTENEFEKLLGDLDESLSGSESSESDEEEDDDRKDSTLTALLKKQATLAERNRWKDAGTGEGDEDVSRQSVRGGSPLLWFTSPLLPTNTYYGVYRALFTNQELEDDKAMVDIVKRKQLAPLSIPKPAKDGTLPQIAYKGPHIFLCMIGGGHFAAMVVSLAPKQTKHGPGPMNREATVLAHKTFHRYTTRRKQGGSQSANDNAKGTAHSAGSGLRRANEVMLMDEVRALLHDWKGLLDTSDLLFIRATGVTNRRTIFGPYEGQVLRANDPRVRGFPFSTRRATQKELMRAFIELTRLKVREIVPVEETKEASTTPAKPSTPKPTKTVLSEEEETALLHTSQLQAMVRRSKLPALLSYIKTNSLSPDFTFQPPDQNYHAPTPLHLAASQNSAVLVTGLVVRAGADPTLKNNDGKTPFELAGDRATRDAFRVARSEAPKWDWEAAKVPAPITRADAEKRQERERKEAETKEAERRKAAEEQLSSDGPRADDSGKKKLGVLGAAGSLKTPQDRREEEARGLTPEMRMRLERERRARAAEERIRRMREGNNG